MAATERFSPGVWRKKEAGKRKRKWNLTINHNGRHNFSGYTDGKATTRLREAILQVLERRRAGESIDTKPFNSRGLEILSDLDVISITTQALRAMDNEALARAYQEALRGRKRCNEYCQTTHTHILDMLLATGFKKQGPGDLVAGPAEQHLNELVESGQIGLSTRNKRRTSIVSFADWLIKQDLRHDNPFLRIPVLNAQKDVRRKRRYVDDDEFAALLEATLKRKCYRTLCNEDRRLVYLIARYGGLRAAEVACLTPCHLDLDAEPAAIVLAGSETKNGLPVRQPIPRFLAEELRPLLRRPAGQRLIRGMWYRRAAEMLADALEAAGIEVADKRGAVADFHALRHTYCTSLGLANVNPKVLQTLSRHSDMRLVMEVYNHAEEILLAGELERAVSSCIPSCIPSPCSELQSSAAEVEGEGEEARGEEVA